jgi:hypothetical protein
MIAGLAYGGNSLLYRHFRPFNEARYNLKLEADSAMSAYDRFIWTGRGGEDPVEADRLLAVALELLEKLERI